MKDIVQLYIPFIEEYISKEFLIQEIRNQEFGEIMNIDMREKKLVKKNTPTRELYSANHYYAFIDLQLFDTIQGNNLEKNIKNNKTTFIMFQRGSNIDKWQLKPYLSIENRKQRGFELHINSKTPNNISLSLQIPQNVKIKQHPGELAPRNKKFSFYDSPSEKMEVYKDYESIEKDIQEFTSRFRIFI